MSDTASLATADIVTLVRASTEAVVAEVRALGERARIRPAPGEWSANEVLGHLIEADRRGFAGRVRTALASDRPTFERWDQPAVAAARHDDERDPEALVEEFLEARRGDLALVESLDAAALDRVGIHPVVGELTVGNILHEWVHHDREHLGQMYASAQTLVRPGMGNARKFSEPNA
jgi:hypothetical protein